MEKRFGPKIEKKKGHNSIFLGKMGHPGTELSPTELWFGLMAELGGSISCPDDVISHFIGVPARERAHSCALFLRAHAHKGER